MATSRVMAALGLSPAKQAQRRDEEQRRQKEIVSYANSLDNYVQQNKVYTDEMHDALANKDWARFDAARAQSESLKRQGPDIVTSPHAFPSQKAYFDYMRTHVPSMTHEEVASTDTAKALARSDASVSRSSSCRN